MRTPRPLCLHGVSLARRDLHAGDVAAASVLLLWPVSAFSSLPLAGVALAVSSVSLMLFLLLLLLPTATAAAAIERWLFRDCFVLLNPAPTESLPGSHRRRSPGTCGLASASNALPEGGGGK